MSRMFRAFRALLFASFLVTPAVVSACSCTNNLTLQEEFDYSWLVFSGRVLEIQTDPFGTLAVLIQPIQRWKGALNPVQVVVTSVDAGACGFAFEVGQEYLIFATMHYYGITYTPTPFTHLCSRSAPLAGNPYLADLPAPILPTSAKRPSWGSLKLRYR